MPSSFAVSAGLKARMVFFQLPVGRCYGGGQEAARKDWLRAAAQASSVPAENRCFSPYRLPPPASVFGAESSDLRFLPCRCDSRPAGKALRGEGRGRRTGDLVLAAANWSDQS